MIYNMMFNNKLGPVGDYMGPSGWLNVPFRAPIQESAEANIKTIMIYNIMFENKLCPVGADMGSFGCLHGPS